MDKKMLARSAGWNALVIGTILAIPLTAAADGVCGYTGGDPKKGDAIYHETCVACHGEDGRGAIPGTPDFTKTGGGVLSKPHATLFEHIKNGFQEPGKPLAMPPEGGNPDLTDQDIKDVHAYLHKAFGCG